MPTKIKNKPVNWSLMELWNSVAYKENKPLVKRDYIYGSEIGLPYCDRFLRMKATPYSNPPNDRSRRKFLSGNIWEHVIRQILIACGVFRQQEVKIDAAPYDDCLPVHGRCDYICGGFIDGELARINVSQLQLPDFLFSIAEKIITSLEGKTLDEKIIELKSISSFGFDKVERMNAPIANHTLQVYHYQKNAGIKSEIAYISKDDARILQFPIVAKHSEPLYRDDLEQMTNYFRKGKRPPVAPLLSFDPIFGRFVKNLHVEYSPYLKMLYNFDSPDHYRESIDYIGKWNRALNRFVLAQTGGLTPGGKVISITPKNREIQTEITKAGYDFNKLVECKIQLGVDAAEEE